MESLKTVLVRTTLLLLLGPIGASGPARGASDDPANATKGVEHGNNAREGDCKGVKIEVMTDSFPGETRWELRDHMSGDTLAFDDPTDANTLHAFCFQGIGCYEFEIFDSGRDGICCDFGEGFYKIYYFDVLVAEGGVFESSEKVSAIGDCDFNDFSVTAPGTWSGGTCGMADDCNLQSTEDVMYEVIIPQDGTWTFSLCDSFYDTYLFVGTSVCRKDVGDNDDASCWPQSELTADLTAGTYYVTIEGFSGCGNYTLSVSGTCICGDETCEASCGEHCGNCPEDCGAYPCPCDTTISSFPNCNGFEGGLGDWGQSSCDHIDWTRHSGPTETLGTGPPAAHGGDFYVYTESSPSGVGNPDKDAILQACFDFTALGDPELSFWYHMLGTTMGSLRVEVSDDTCGTWTEVWSISGNQWFDWHEAQVDLSAYAGSIVTIRFVGTTGDGITSDMAVDDICVDGTTVSLCPDGTAMVFDEHGLTDAGQPYPIDDAAAAQGYQVFHATGPEGATDPSCWSLTETNAGGCGNSIAGVVESPPGRYTITLDRPLQSRAVTTITYDWGTGSTSGVFTALPGDANGSGQTGTGDIGAVINCLNSGACALWACDIDRLGGCTGADLERLVDLLNGAGPYNGWEGATPAAADCPPI